MRADLQLHSLNLNLIPVLRTLLRERSVSRAATVLGRSPPAVSATLAQLRAALQDPLFIRVGGRLQPTAKAAELEGPLEELCAHLESFLKPEAFAPETSERKFVIAASDILVFSLGLQIVELLRRTAPNMSVQFIDIGRNLLDGMAAQDIDFALLPDFAMNDIGPAPLKFQRMQASSGDVALMSAEHPLASRPLVTREELTAYPRLEFRPDPVLLRGRKPEPASGSRVVTVSQFMTMPFLLEGTDLIAITPRSIAEDAVKIRELAIVDLGFAPEVQFGLAWSPVFEHEPAHKWLRSSLQAAKKSRPVRRSPPQLRLAPVAQASRA